mgnify:CR=1 FL=1
MAQPHLLRAIQDKRSHVQKILLIVQLHLYPKHMLGQHY